MGPSTSREKRKWPAEFAPTSPPVVNPESLMVGSRGATREAQAGHMHLERLTEIAATQWGMEERYALDLEIIEAVKRLPGYLQPMVTLMATMVPSSEESKMREKRGWEVLAQANSMVLIVSILVHLNLHHVTAGRLSNDLFFFLFRAP